MKLNLANAPQSVISEESPKPGDIYRKRGGPLGYWWVISTCENGDCYVLSFDLGGNLTGAQRYARYYFARNESRRVGFAEVPIVNPEWFTSREDYFADRS